MTQSYPLEMFGRGFRVLVAFINYYPARYLLGKIELGDPWYWLSIVSPLVAAVLLGAAAFVWNKGLRAYNSTGS
jgi:ABC-2 type transport system permease protein